MCALPKRTTCVLFAQKALFEQCCYFNKRTYLNTGMALHVPLLVFLLLYLFFYIFRAALMMNPAQRRCSRAFAEIRKALLGTCARQKGECPSWATNSRDIWGTRMQDYVLWRQDKVIQRQDRVIQRKDFLKWKITYEITVSPEMKLLMCFFLYWLIKEGKIVPSKAFEKKMALRTAVTV